MIWLTWRQFRASAVAAAAALAALAAVLALTGPGLANDYATGLASCSSQGGAGASSACMALGQQFFHDHKTAFLAVTGLALILPALIGLFWGAPLVAHEVEAGTHGLVWNQSITRTRWLAVKLGLVGLAAMIAAGLGSVAVTWWASPLDSTAAADFPRMEPLLFAARGIVPIGYAAFAFALGVAAGILVRRPQPAMAITLAVFVAMQVVTPALIRPHVLAPIETTFEISDSNAEGFKVMRVGPDQVTVDAGETGAWLLSHRVVDASGRAVDAMDVSTAGPCVSARQDREACFAEMTRLGYRLEVTHQPAGRFWPFQWIETGIYMALALGLAGFCCWRIRRDIS